MFPLKLSENHKFTDDFRGLSHFSLRNTSVIRQKGESQNLRVHISGYKMFVFRNIWRALFSWNTRFEICLFALLPTNVKSEILRQSMNSLLSPHILQNKSSPEILEFPRKYENFTELYLPFPPREFLKVLLK